MLTTIYLDTGYNLKTDVFFMPIAAQSFMNIKERIPAGVCPWYNGPSLLEYLDQMKSLERKLHAPFMMPVSDSSWDKIQSRTILN